MAAPSLIALTTVNIKTAIADATTSEADLIASIASGHAANVEAVFASNNHSSLAGYIWVCVRRSSSSKIISNGQRVNTKQTINVLLGKPLYLEEGDQLRIYADANGIFTCFAPYTDLF